MMKKESKITMNNCEHELKERYIHYWTVPNALYLSSNFTKNINWKSSYF